MFNPKRPVVFINLEELRRMKNERLVPAQDLRVLHEFAEGLLSEPTLKVTARRLKAPSGNPHDYTSMGPYWWPNPDTPDGLPYIRRDGYTNPDTVDKNEPVKLFFDVFKMALAAYYFDDDRYAEYAERQLYDWFVNPETHMKPHGKYVQAIPGICEGRGVGLIDFNHSYYLFDGVRILEAIGKIDPETVRSIEIWFSDFTDWMLTDEIGLSEANANGNHASWYDSQIICAALFTGRKNLVNFIADSYYKRRLMWQMRDDGGQPEELIRTKALNYSVFNIAAAISIAKIAIRRGDERYLKPDPTRGFPLIRRMVDFVWDAWKNPDEFGIEEIHSELVCYNLHESLAEMAALYPGEGYEEKANETYAVGDIYNLFPHAL